MKPDKWEFYKTDSNFSSMRLVFIWLVKTAIAISMIASVGALILPLLKLPFDVNPFIVLITAILTVAMGSKVGQSFAERPTTPPKPNQPDVGATESNTEASGK